MRGVGGGLGVYKATELLLVLSELRLRSLGKGRTVKNLRNSSGLGLGRTGGMATPCFDCWTLRKGNSGYMVRFVVDSSVGKHGGIESVGVL